VIAHLIEILIKKKNIKDAKDLKNFLISKKNTNSKFLFDKFQKFVHTIKLKNIGKRFKILRYFSNNAVIFYLFISQMMFGPNMFMFNYFKKAQTHTFQLQISDTSDLNVLQISRIYPRIEKFEFLLIQKTPSYVVSERCIFFKNISLLNLHNFAENFFYNTKSCLTLNNYT
jgi:hypothetical protein